MLMIGEARSAAGCQRGRAVLITGVGNPNRGVYPAGCHGGPPDSYHLALGRPRLFIDAALSVGRPAGAAGAE
jgi:hypothetical protein